MKYTGALNVIDEHGELLYERELSSDEIIGELLLQFHTQDSIEPTRKKEQEEPIRFKRGGPRRCGQCSKTGHTRPTCPVLNGGTRVIDEDDDRECPACTRPGRGVRHNKDCPTKNAPEPYKGEAKGPMLNEEQFEMVMDAKSNDLHFNALICAEELDADMREVNRAILTGSWDRYTQSYRTTS